MSRNIHSIGTIPFLYKTYTMLLNGMKNGWVKCYIPHEIMTQYASKFYLYCWALSLISNFSAKNPLCLKGLAWNISILAYNARLYYSRLSIITLLSMISIINCYLSIIGIRPIYNQFIVSRP